MASRFSLGDFQLALESSEHGLLVSFACHSPNDAVSPRQSAFSSSEEAGLHPPRPTFCSSPSSSSFSDTLQRNVCTSFSLSDTCFAARRSDVFRSMYPGLSNPSQNNASLPSDLKRGGAARQTAIHATEDDMQPPGNRIHHPAAAGVRRFPLTGTWVS